MNLDAIRSQLGQPKRKLGWFQSSPLAFEEPRWLSGVSAEDDPIKELFQGFNSLWKHGVIVWGWVVRANASLYSPGDDDCPGTVIFSATAPDDVALGELQELSKQLNDLRDADAPDPSWTVREREWWEDLQNDMSHHRGFRLPQEWQKGVTDYKGSSVILHREHLPGRLIQSRVVPLLVDPVSSLAQTIPCTYWPQGMSEWLSTEYGVCLKSDNRLSSPSAALESLVDHPIEHSAREAALQRIFGPIESVLHEVIPSPQHIDVYCFKWSAPRDEHGWVTGGMSDALQPNAGDFGRIELVFYSKQKLDLYPEMLRVFARYPWQTGAPIFPGDSIPLGPHAEQVLGSSRFPALLFFPGVSKAETSIHTCPEFAEQDIRFLTVIPITQAELDLNLEQGFGALLDRMQGARFDLAFSPERQCLVAQ